MIDEMTLAALEMRRGASMVMTPQAQLRRQHLYFFGGVDPAPSEGQRSDDGALMVACAQPKIIPEKGQAFSNVPADWWFDYVYARRLTHKEKASARQYSGIIHALDRSFGCAKWVMDFNGGGTYVQRELLEPKQLINGIETDVVPIADTKTGPSKVVRGNFILHMFGRGDPGIEEYWGKLAGDEMLNDAAYCMLKDDIDNGQVGIVPMIEEWMGERRATFNQWSDERQWSAKNLSAFVDQLKTFKAETEEDGTYKVTGRGSRKFFATGKKDFVSAGVFTRLGFHLWLKQGGFEAEQSEEDAAGFLGC